MSFGFGVGDFLAVGQLALQLYNAFADAPDEVQELTNELFSIQLVLAGLEQQAKDPNSPLQKDCADRKDDWLQLRGNFENSLKELERLVAKYKDMGYNPWKRISAGLNDFGNLRIKLSSHMQSISLLFANTSLSSLGRLETQIGSLDSNMKLVARLLIQSVREERAGIRAESTILGANENPDGPEWHRMKMDLRLAGLTEEDLESNSGRIRELLKWSVENAPDLTDLGDVGTGDSVSQQDSLQVIEPPPAARVTEKKVKTIEKEVQDIRILIMGDFLGHFGMLFESHFQRILPKCRFPNDCRLFRRLSYKWMVDKELTFVFEFCGLRDDHDVSTSGYPTKRRNRIAELLQRQTRRYQTHAIEWHSARFQCAADLRNSIGIGKYQYILIAPDNLTERPLSKWAYGLIRPKTAVLDSTTTTWTSYKRFDAISLSTGRLMPGTSFTRSLLQPYPDKLIQTCNEDAYYQAASNQVMACVRGFIEEVLGGTCSSFDLYW